MDENTEQILHSIVSRVNGFAYRCRMDDSYTMVFMSGKVHDICGRSEKDFFGNAVIGYAQVVNPEDSPKVDALVEESLKTGAHWDVEYRIIRPDGSNIWVRETGGGVQGEDGNAEFLEGFILDISDEVEARAELGIVAESSKHLADNVMHHVDVFLKIIRRLTMLSFNARIEASKAGEAGAGFAVVSQEMHSLAQSANGTATAITELAKQSK